MQIEVIGVCRGEHCCLLTLKRNNQGALYWRVSNLRPIYDLDSYGKSLPRIKLDDDFVYGYYDDYHQDEIFCTIANTYPFEESHLNVQN